MIWLAWRQQRFGFIVVAAFLALVAIAFAFTGPHLAHVYDTTVQHCAAHGDCGPVTQSFTNEYLLLQDFIQLMVIFPLVVGAFWGAPLVAREFETGTFRMAWTQSVTRTRWLAIKLGVGALGVATAAGLFSFMATWWSSPLDRLNASPFGEFDAHDLAPIGYALFAFALAVTVGALVRRTLPAIITTLFGFIAARLAVTNWVRPRFRAPLVKSAPYRLPFSTENGALGRGPIGLKPGDWLVSETTRNKAGEVVGRFGGIGNNGSINFGGRSPTTVYFRGVGKCPNVFPPHSPLYAPTRAATGAIHVSTGPSSAMLHAMQTCASSFHLTSVLTYQPASRYWLFQWDELGLFTLVALAMGGLSLWWVRRH